MMVVHFFSGQTLLGTYTIYLQCLKVQPSNQLLMLVCNPLTSFHLFSSQG